MRSIHTPFIKRFYHLTPLLLFLVVQGCAANSASQFPAYAKYEGEVNQHTRFIRAERNQIFHILTLQKTFNTICPKGTTVFHEMPLPYQVGTLVRTQVDNRFKLTWNSRVEELIPDEKIRLRFIDGFFAGGTELWKLEAQGAGTLITHTIIIQPPGILKKLAWNLKFRRKNDTMVEILLDNLKKAAETHRD